MLRDDPAKLRACSDVFVLTTDEWPYRRQRPLGEFLDLRREE